MLPHLPQISLALLLALLATGLCSAAETPRDGSLRVLPHQPLAPPFRLPDLDGKLHRLGYYRGQVVMVSFWATWCPPCRTEMPAMEAAWKKLGDGNVIVLAINVGQNEAAVRRFLADHPVAFPVLLDQASHEVQAWPVRGLPTTYVVDTAGRLAYRAVGEREWDDPALLSIVRDLLKEGS